MKKEMIISLSTTILIALLIVVISFAWYTNVKKTSSVDFVSNGTILQYTINDSEDKNVTEYDVEGVTFFDINNTNEGYYFTDMAVCLELNITNYSKDAVTLSLEGETQSHTLSVDIDENVVTIYSCSSDTVNNSSVHALPTRETFADFTDLYTYGYDSTASSYVYTKATAYTSGETYYQRTELVSLTLTVANSIITNVTTSSSDMKLTIMNSGTEICAEKYVAVDKTLLTADIFNAGNAGFYYTVSEVDGVNVYTHAKEFDSSTQYYELQTLAYLSDITLESTKATAIGSAVNGAYITCAISGTKLDSKEYTYTAVDTSSFTSSTDVSGYYVLDGTTYVAATGTYSSGTTYYLQKPVLSGKSVSSFLNGTYSNRYTHSVNLTGITTTEDSSGNVTKITPGMSVTVYVYIYGVQPYDNATNNFLEDTLNTYPFKLTISAE